MKQYTQVYAAMSKEQLWHHIIMVVRENNLTAEASWYGSGDSGELNDYGVGGENADTQVECIRSTHSYEWCEKEQETKNIITSRGHTCSLQDYIIDMAERLAEMANIDWYNNDGGRLWLYIDDSEATWEEYYNVSHEELGASLGDVSNESNKNNATENKGE